jgi:hypothetical protein
MRIPILPIAVASMVLFSGCATYIPPSGRADLATVSSPSMQESFAAKPATGFPVSIAAVRVQAPRYRSYHTEREGGVFGQGRYTVMSSRWGSHPLAECSSV